MKIGIVGCLLLIGLIVQFTQDTFADQRHWLETSVPVNHGGASAGLDGTSKEAIRCEGHRSNCYGYGKGDSNNAHVLPVAPTLEGNGSYSQSLFSAQIEVLPTAPNSGDDISLRIFDDWPNSCIPHAPTWSKSGNRIFVDFLTAGAGTVCAQVISSWDEIVTVGELPAGNYEVVVTDCHDVVSCVGSGDPIGNTSFTVTPQASYAASASISIYPESSTGATDSKVDVVRVFDSNSGNDVNVGLRNYQARLDYDGSCVNILGVQPMDFLGSTISIDNNAGFTTFSGVDASGVPWPADLGHFRPRLVGSANQQCQLSLEVASLSEVNGNPISVPAVLTQTLRRGDARADGRVNIADALYIAQHLVGQRTACTTTSDTTCVHSLNAASTRHDGAFERITIADALFIAQYLVGVRDKFYNLAP